MMNKILGAGLSLLLAAALIITPSGSRAAELRTGEQPGTSGTERVTDDLYLAGANAVSAGTIIGDLVMVGGNLTIDGIVNSDVLTAGGSVTIIGDIQDDVRAAGGNVTIGGTVDGDVVAAGGNVQMTGKRIGGDVLARGGSVRLDAAVGKDVRLAGGQISINSPIAGNVEVDAEQLTLGSGAVITGTLTYRSPNQATFEKGATVKGKTTYVPITRASEKPETGAAGIIATLGIVSFLTLLFCAMVIGLSLRRWSGTLVAAVHARPLLELGRGFSLLVATPIACIILMATVIGIPFGLIGLLAYVILLAFSHFTAPIVLGSLLYGWIAKQPASVTWKAILLGVVVYALLAWIPIVGWVVRFGIFLVTLGAIARIKWDTAKQWR